MKSLSNNYHDVKCSGKINQQLLDRLGKPFYMTYYLLVIQAVVMHTKHCYKVDMVTVR